MQRLENTADGNLWMIAYDRHSLYLYDIRENKLINVLKQYEQHFNTPLQIENLYPLSKGVTWVTLNNGGCFRISDKAQAYRASRYTLEQTKFSLPVTNATFWLQ